jgi:VWFA-related protein
MAAGSAVEFVSPRHLATAVGPTTIELRVSVPAGRSVERLVITVDGDELATLTAPPWTTVWDAGDAARGHRLEATLQLSDGTLSRGVIRTSPLRINQIEEVGLVNLYVIVRDENGQYVSDLTREDFEILEDGIPQEIRRFSSERKPLHVGVVLDTSLSMGRKGKLQSARKAALGFLEVLEPYDQGMIVTFSDDVRMAQDITNDKSAMAGAIQATESRGGTALYDAIWRSSKSLEAFDGRRVLVLLSDGRDEAASGFEPGSLHTRHEAEEQALRSEVMIFSIGLGERLDREYPSLWERPRDGTLGDSLAEILGGMAASTGGRLLLSPGARQLRKAFRDVAEDLRNQYSLAYVPTDEDRDGGWRRVQVRTPGRQLEIIGRKGYFAQPAGETASQGSAIPR